MAKFFYNSRKFVGERGRLLAKDDTLRSVEIRSDQPSDKARLLAYFDILNFERVGVLKGEYVVLNNALILVDSDGICIKINIDGDDMQAARFDLYCVSEPVQALIVQIQERWDEIQLVHDMPLVSTFWSKNYYHFSLELITKFRLFDPFGVDTFVLPQTCFALPAYGELIRWGLQERHYMPISAPLRVRDPILATTYLSQDGLMWLRGKAGINALSRSGMRRIYLRRMQSGRPGPSGGLSEDAAFLDFLARHRFEVVDFGNGERNVTNQLRLIEGAGIILSTHGASLTNIAYLNKPLTIIEIFSNRHLEGMYMNIANMLGFAYFGIISDRLDSQGGIVVDCDMLSEIMRNL